MQLLDDLERFSTVVVPRTLSTAGSPATTVGVACAATLVAWYAVTNDDGLAHVLALALIALLAYTITKWLLQMREQPPELVRVDRSGVIIGGARFLDWDKIDVFQTWSDTNGRAQIGVRLRPEMEEMLLPDVAAQIAARTGSPLLLPLTPGLPQRFDAEDVVTVLNVARRRLDR